MANEDGFTLVEMLAALAIMTLLTVSLGKMTMLSTEHWERIQNQLSENRVLRQLQSDVYPEENALKSQPALVLDRPSELVGAIPRRDVSPNCVFDLVSRQCRR